MPLFHYHAQTVDGETLSGMREAASEGDLSAQLAAEGLELLFIEISETDIVEAEPAGTQKKAPALRRTEVEDFVLHLSDLVQARLPLSEGLAAFAAEMPHFGRLRYTMQAVSERLRSGGDLAGILDDLHFPRDLTALVKVGVQTGRLSDVLTQYAVQTRRAADLRWQFWSSQFYPLVICTLTSIMLLGALYSIVPMFKAIFDDFGTQLPGITVLLVSLSDLVRNYGGLLFLLAIALFAIALLVWSTLLTPLFRDSLRAMIPVAGQVFRLLGLARFAQTLAILVEHQLPLPAALRYAGDGCGDELTRVAATGLAEEIESGKPVGTAARLLPDFPVSVLETYEQRQFRPVLPDTLRTLAEMYETRTQGDLAFFAWVLEPTLFIACGWLLFGVVLALFMPLLKLLNDLS